MEESEIEEEYIEHLNVNVPPDFEYGEFLRDRDPIQFNVGFSEWLKSNYVEYQCDDCGDVAYACIENGTPPDDWVKVDQTVLCGACKAEWEDLYQG